MRIETPQELEAHRKKLEKRNRIKAHLYWATYYSKNKDKRSVKNHKYYLEHKDNKEYKEKIKANRKKWYSVPKNRIKQIERVMARYKKLKEIL